MFEAHGLVRQGMRALAALRIRTRGVSRVGRATATVLTEHGQTEAAFALLVEIESTARAIETLEQLAERYAAQGQVELLMTSIGKVPAAEVERNAWLCFWTGQALLRVDEEHARHWFGRITAFETASDRAGMRLAAASVVTAFGLEWGDLARARHMDRTPQECGRRHTGSYEGDRFETSLIMGVMCAAFVRAAYPPRYRLLMR